MHVTTLSSGESHGIDLASARLSPSGLGVEPAAIRCGANVALDICAQDLR